ncbi:MAG: hypothetical protein OXN26_04565 [Gammaproteobacteria bacterium]|nr:hypothetical protein [Gammaproteobacteria bacterium]
MYLFYVAIAPVMQYAYWNKGVEEAEIKNFKKTAVSFCLIPFFRGGE